jgi:hypothetical protein
MSPRMLRLIRLTTLATIGGICLQLGGCLGSAVSYAANINPCGTLLNCDPVTYDFITSGYEGPGADPDVDPACTYPPFCGPDVDPFAP